MRVDVYHKVKEVRRGGGGTGRRWENRYDPTSKSVVMRTRDEPDRNSLMMMSRSFWSMSPCYTKVQREQTVIHRHHARI